MPSKQELVFLLLFFVSFSDHSFGVTGSVFTDDELKFFSSLGLCDHFGGACGSECPFRFITHKWGVPLCPDDSALPLECCIGPAEVETADTEFFTTTESPTTTDSMGSGSPAPEYENCGELEVPPSRFKRIVGGKVASPESWPWLVAFRSMLGSHACSGAVVAQRWIITAAHCFKYVSNPGLWRVRIGEYNLLTHEDRERDVQVQEIIMHPGYKARQMNNMDNQTLHAKYVHDIALVRLYQDTLTVPICLPLPHLNQEKNVEEDLMPSSAKKQKEKINEMESRSITDNIIRSVIETVTGVHPFNEIPQMGLNDVGEKERKALQKKTANCWVAGWGTTLEATLEDQVLREVSGEVINSEECSQMWGEQLEGDMLCFGDGTYGPCAGDSGGPLSCKRDGRFYLTGVVSWGTEDCNTSGYPSVFTNIEPYVKWIQLQMRKYKFT